MVDTKCVHSHKSGRILCKMLCCKSVNWEGYTVSIVPDGIKGKFKFPSSYSGTDTEWSSYYLLPCFNGLPITFVLSVIDKSDKQLTALKYQWRVSNADKSKDTEHLSNIGYLRAINRDDRTLQDSFTIASDHILIPGQYKLQIQLSHYDESIVMKWYQFANFNVISWDTFHLFAWGLLVGLVGTIIAIIVQIVLANLK